MNEADIELLRKQAEGSPDEDALERIESLETLVDALQDVVDKQAAVIEDLHRSVDSYLRIVETQDKIIALLKQQQERLREALEDIRVETTEDIAGLPRDEALIVITWVRERAEKALKQEV